MAGAERVTGGASTTPAAAAGPLAGVTRPPSWCEAHERLRDVAARLPDTESCVLVRGGIGLGIVTDHDFRRFVATGQVPVDAPIGDIATRPVVTVDATATAAEALVRMLEHGIHHLAVVRGAARGDPVGVLRAADLAHFGIAEPLALRSAIAAASTLDEVCVAGRRVMPAVADLRLGGVPAVDAGAVHSTLVDEILRRVLALRMERATTASRPQNPSGASPLAQVAHSWLVLGSHARREPLPASDLDTALTWVDPPGDGPEARNQSASPRAEELRGAARSVLEDLRRCGLQPCPNGANADNPRFSRSQAGWHEAMTDWQRDPTRDDALLLAAMVTDSRPVTNAPLGSHLADALMSRTRTSAFLRALLDEAVRWRTSTRFWRDFLVDRAGAHRGQLDLKRGGLFPVVALGRWIAIVTGVAGGSTPERLQRGVDAELLSTDERDTLLVGFNSVYTVLYDHEVAAYRSGATPDTYIRPRDLGTLARRHLRETLRAVAAVQDRVDQFWLRRLDHT